MIITDRVLKDNRYLFENDEAIRKELEKDRKCEVIIIPEYHKEKTGHADGLIRFIENKKAFINETQDKPNKELLRKFLKVLEKNQLESMLNEVCYFDFFKIYSLNT